MKITPLKLIRQNKGLTQEELAEKSKVALRTYCYYEAGERVPDAHTAQRLANALGTTVDDLFPLPSEKTSPLQNTQENSITES